MVSLPLAHESQAHWRAERVEIPQLMPPDPVTDSLASRLVLLSGVLIFSPSIHDYVNLRLLINLIPDLHNAIRCKLNCIFHVLIHLALVTD